MTGENRRNRLSQDGIVKEWTGKNDRIGQNMIEQDREGQNWIEKDRIGQNKVKKNRKNQKMTKKQNMT